jgi:type IV secretory pathway VirB6-like protein
MKVTFALVLTATALWSLILATGFAGIDGVRSHNVPGYPSDDQLRYYIYTPAGVLALVGITWALSVRFRLLKALLTLVAVAALLSLPSYLYRYTGGV